MLYVMQKCDQLQKELSCEDTGRWYDDACIYASELLKQFSEDDYRKLSNLWSQWSLNEQLHLAYILDEGDSRFVVPILESMMESDNKDIALTSWESNNDLTKLMKPE